jgi:hypothetical protein
MGFVSCSSNWQNSERKTPSKNARKSGAFKGFPTALRSERESNDSRPSSCPRNPFRPISNPNSCALPSEASRIPDRLQSRFGDFVTAEVYADFGTSASRCQSEVDHRRIQNHKSNMVAVGPQGKSVWRFVLIIFLPGHLDWARLNLTAWRGRARHHRSL